jgi:hypothetical protein
MIRWPGAALGLLAAVVCVTPEASAQQLPTRANIDILIVADDQIAATRMNQWSNALISRLSKLSNDSSLGMKRPISVKPFPQKTFVGANALQTRWTQRRAIQIVLAQGVSVGDKVTAEGDLYLGALKGDLASPLVPIKQPITPENFQKASDYIVMTSLYALAVDAGSQKPVACALLQRANVIGKTIPAALDMANVRGAVAKRLAAAKCAVSR